MSEFWITIAAIVCGPFFAVLAAQKLENRRRDYNGRHNVFRTLMKTRKTWGSPEHVEALNLVEIEYRGRSKVLEAYKTLFEYFEKDIPKREDEDLEQYGQRKAVHHSDLLSALLLAMSKDLGYRHEQFEILRGGYSPVLHGQIEEEQQKVRRLFAGLHDGTAVLPVAVVDVRHPEKLLDQARDTQLLIENAAKKEAIKK